MNKLVQTAIRKLNMKNLFLIFMLIFTIIPSVILLSVSTVYTRNTVTDSYSHKYLDAIHDTLSNNLSDILYQINISSTTLSSIKDVTHTLNSNESYAAKKSVIEANLADIMEHDAMLSGILIATGDGENFSCSLSGEELKFEDNAFLSGLSKTAFSVYNKCIISGDNYYIVLGRDFFNYTTGEEMGKILFYIESDTLYSIYSDSIISGAEMFLTCSDNVILHSDKSKINTTLFVPSAWMDNTKTNSYTVSEFYLDLPLYNSDLKAVSIISHIDTLTLIKHILSRFWIAFAFIILLSFFISYFMAKRITVSLANLKHSVEQFADDIDTEFQTSPSNEIYALEVSFERMVMQIKNLTRMNNIEKEKQRIAELNTLQAQISPHFIYNALDIAYCLAKLKGQTEVEEIIYALASYFRLGLHNASTYTTVENEIKHVESFLIIEKIRFPKLFDVSFDVDERVKNYKMIKIVVQPIVENSIKHGFKNIDYKGLISIKVTPEDNGDVLFVISDNGVGMDTLPTMVPSEKNGFGLFNVNERLIRSYGSDYGLKFISEKGSGTTVSFKIKPLQDEQAAEE